MGAPAAASVLSISSTPSPSLAFSGLDLLALLALLHGWLIVVGITAYAHDDDPAAEPGSHIAGRRISLGVRPFAVWTLAGVLVIWYPFVTGSFPIWPAEDPTVLPRAGFFLFVIGALAVGGGCYYLGGAVSELRSALAFRRSGIGDIDAIEPGRTLVSGRIGPHRETINTPLTGTDAVWYQLFATESGVPGRTHRLDHDGVPFVLAAGTGRVLVDPTHVDVRLEPAASERVAGDDVPPEPLATNLHESRYLDDVDADREYRETRLEPDETVTVLGLGRPEDVADDDDGDDGNDAPTSGTSSDREPAITHSIRAQKPATELVIARGRDPGVVRYRLETAGICLLAALVLIGGGVGVLWTLAGHWTWSV